MDILRLIIIMMGMRQLFTFSLPWLLLFSIALRSMVAPGYMFANVDENGDFTLSLTWCYGINESYSTQDKAGHDHHQSDDGQTRNPEDHFTAACGLLSGSSTFISPNFHIASGLFYERSSFPVPDFADARRFIISYRNNPTRAPPALNII